MDGVAAGAGSGNDPLLLDDVPDGEVAAEELKGDGLLLASFEFNLFEAAELADRGVVTRVLGEFEVELGDGFAGSGAGILDVDGDFVDGVPEVGVAALGTAGLGGFFLGGGVAGGVGVGAFGDGGGVVEVGVDEEVGFEGDVGGPGDFVGVGGGGGVGWDWDAGGLGAGGFFGWGLDGLDGEARVREGGVAETVSEFIAGGDGLLVEPLVVYVETLGEALGAGGLLDLHGRAIVGEGLANGVWEMAAWGDVTEEDLGEGASGFLTWEMGNEDGLDVGKVGPFLHVDGTNSVDDDNGVWAGVGNALDQVITVVPEVNVVTVSLMTSYGNESAKS